MAEIVAERYTGASIKRSEDPRILTGSGRYVDDIKLPGMLHAAFVRSPLAHARVLSVDVSAARALPGVVTAFTGADLETMTVPGPDALSALIGAGGPTAEFTLLATDKVRFVGDPVAVVIAESRYLAEDGCELVEVEYDDLPPVASAAVALDPASPPLFANLGDNIARPHSRSEFGDVGGTFGAADRVFDFRIDVHRHQNVPMEGRACVASYDPDAGVMTMHAATQSVHVSKIAVVMRLGMEPDKVRVLAGDVGGSFGLKIGASREELAVAAASRALGQPVKWVEDRGENLLASGQAREESFDVRAAVSNDGDLLGLDVKMVIDTGAYPGMGGMVPSIIEAMLPGPYKLAALGFESTAVITNKASYVAYRGPWASETFVRERILDVIAKDLGLDPVEIRLRNVAPRTDPPAVMITGRPLVGVTTRESLERITELVDIPAFRRRQAEARARGRYLGIGVATFIEAAPGPRSPEGPSGPMGVESMRLRLDEEGMVVLFTGQMPHGQSHQTTLAQIAADEFGVPFEQVRVVVGDTDVVPFGLTGGSRSATMTGGVALHGARQLKAKVLDFASHLMEASAQDLQIVDGNVFVRGDPDSAITVSEVARQAASGQLGADVDVDAQSRGRGDVRRRRRRLVGRQSLRHRRRRRRDRPGDGGTVRRRRRLRRTHQPGRSRGPDPRRRRAGHRRGAARTIGVRRGRQLPVSHVHGLPAAHRLRRSPHRDRAPGDRASRRRRQLPRSRRGRHDRRAAHDSERHRGRAFALRRANLRAAPTSGPHPGTHCRCGLGSIMGFSWVNDRFGISWQLNLPE